MTINEAARALGLSPSTVKNQVLAGRIRANPRREGYPITISAAEVERYRTASKGKPGRRPTTHVHAWSSPDEQGIAICLDSSCRRPRKAAR